MNTDFEKKYYKFKNKYLRLRKQIFGGEDGVEVKPVIVKNYNNGLGYYEINYIKNNDIIVNGKETKTVKLNINMQYTPDSEVKISIDEDKNELDMVINLTNNSTSNVKIIGIISKESKNTIKECLKNLLEYSYTKQLDEHDVLTTQEIIFNYKDQDNVNPIYWLGEEL